MKISSVQAPGYSIIVEMLSESETAPATALILNNRDKESNHAYVKSVGPLVDTKAGVKEGDLVIVQGNYIPVPNPSATNRKWGSVELHSIKAVLSQEEVECKHVSTRACRTKSS